jgi:dihydroorotase
MPPGKRNEVHVEIPIINLYRDFVAPVGLSAGRRVSTNPAVRYAERFWRGVDAAMFAGRESGTLERNMDTLTLTRPDDWHVHLRDGDMLAAVLPDTARRFARAIVMPNLKPPVRSVSDAAAYRERILAAIPAGMAFEPLMTLYLTDNTTPEEIIKASESGFVHAVKYYPAGATTNSDSGVTDVRRVGAALEAMQEVGLPLLMHGEVTDPDVDLFDREAVFIDRILAPLLQRQPALKVVLEHITTRQAAEFVASAPANVAATITAHHLLYNRNAMFQGGIRPHYYCLPVLKRETHREALIAAATSGNPKYFLGTDSAPHATAAKETACGCAGIYTAHAAIELYAEAFESADALDKLEGFASRFGADFYGLPRNGDTITLVRDRHVVPAGHGGGVTPLRANEHLAWRLV